MKVRKLLKNHRREDSPENRRVSWTGGLRSREEDAFKMPTKYGPEKACPSRDETLDYRIVRSRRRRRTLALSIEEDGAVVVRVPWRTSRESVSAFVKEKEAWIKKKLGQIMEQKQHKRQRHFIPGERFFYLGQLHALQITSNEAGPGPLVLGDGLFRLNADFQERGRDLFIQWYQEQAEAIIPQRVRHYQEKVQVHPRGERITSAKHQWGGCSARDTLTFTWRLIMAPLRIVDYVVVHELAHLRERNHSSRFWKIVEQHLPDYRDRRKWLREHGHLLNL